MHKKSAARNRATDSEHLNFRYLTCLLDKGHIKGWCLYLMQQLLILLSYIYDINFRETLEIIDKENYVNKILNRFDFKDEKTKEQIEELKKILLKFIKTSLRKK